MAIPINQPGLHPVETSSVPAALQRLGTWMVWLGLAIWLAGAAAWVVRQPMFQLRAIQVLGEPQRSSERSFRSQALPQLSGHFFSLSLADARQAFEQVPWVRHAIVRRVWPNQIKVHIEEHRPAAVWRGLPAEPDGEISEAIVNTFGEVFEANVGDVEDESLPVFQGPQGTSQDILQAYQSWASLLAPQQMRIAAITLSERRTWRLQLDSGMEIVLGRGQSKDLGDKLRIFLSEQQAVSKKYQRPVVYADLRHKDGFAVRLPGVSTLDSKPPGARN